MIASLIRPNKMKLNLCSDQKRYVMRHMCTVVAKRIGSDINCILKSLLLKLLWCLFILIIDYCAEWSDAFWITPQMSIPYKPVVNPKKSKWTSRSPQIVQTQSTYKTSMDRHQPESNIQNARAKTRLNTLNIDSLHILCFW